MFTRLDPPIPLHVLDRGDGLAFAVIDYGVEHDLIWVTAIDATGEIWCAGNPKVRMQANWTMGRPPAATVCPCLSSDAERALTAAGPVSSLP